MNSSFQHFFFAFENFNFNNVALEMSTFFFPRPKERWSEGRIVGTRTQEEKVEENIWETAVLNLEVIFYLQNTLFSSASKDRHTFGGTRFWGVRKVRIFHALHRLLVADWQSSCRRVICQCVFFVARWSISTSEDAIFHSRIENISLSDHEPRLVSESSSVDCDFNQDDDDYGEMAEGNTKSLHFN